MKKFNTQIKKIFTANKQESFKLNESFWGNVKTALSNLSPIKSMSLAKKAVEYEKVITDFEATLQEITQLATQLEKIKPKTSQTIATEKIIAFNHYLIEAQPGPDTWAAAGDPSWWSTPSAPAQNTTAAPAQNTTATNPQLSELQRKIGSYYPKVIELQTKCTEYIEAVREFLIFSNKNRTAQYVPKDLWTAETRLNTTLTKIQQTLSYIEREAADFVQKSQPPSHPILRNNNNQQQTKKPMVEPVIRGSSSTRRRRSRF